MDVNNLNMDSYTAKTTRQLWLFAIFSCARRCSTVVEFAFHRLNHLSGIVPSTLNPLYSMMDDGESVCQPWTCLLPAMGGGRSKKLLGAKGIATRSKDATSGLTTRSKNVNMFRCFSPTFVSCVPTPQLKPRQNSSHLVQAPEI